MAKLEAVTRTDAAVLVTLRTRLWQATQTLATSGLVILTEGNVSERSPDGRFFAIKPSGVAYTRLKPQDMVVLDMEGKIIDGRLRPSSDTPTHLEVYRAFPEIGGMAHTHSPYAAAWAQAMEHLPCYGTTHADAFGDQVPVTRQLTAEEVRTNYEQNIGKMIVKTIDASHGAVLVAGHASFTFGRDGAEAVAHALILEKVAFMATLKRPAKPIPDYLRQKHHSRKHGPKRYYGQP